MPSDARYAQTLSGELPRTGPYMDGGITSGKLYAIVDAVSFIGVVNLMMIAMTFAGGVVLGFAPSLAAAAAVTRARLRGEGGSVVGRFVRVWKVQFIPANGLQLPGLLTALLLLVNYLALGGKYPVLGTVLLVALAVAAIHHLTVVAMDAHYDLRRRDCLVLAARFLVVAPGSPLLLAATLAVIAFITWLVPGLLPVFSLGAAAYFCTALCLSFFAANDRRIPA
jgi:uncharacterized membrane protein YesL